MVASHGGGVQGLAVLEAAAMAGGAGAADAPRDPHRCGCADATHHACDAAADAADDRAALSDQLARLALGPNAAAAAAAKATAAAGTAKAVSPAPPAPARPLALPDAGLAGVAELIRYGRARRIVVMAGAGISVSAGIPDFRTPGTGLYSQLQRYRLPYPEAVFSIDYFRRDPKPFYTLAKELFPGEYAPTPTHFFLKLLADKGLLLRVFTQNIDGLEQLAGVPPECVVPAHGSFDLAHCIDCRRPASVYAVQAAVHDDTICRCDSCGGLVKPDIVFFGEPLPARFHRRRAEDMGQADLLIVMGTSLVVQPFASMIADVGPDVPRLLINRERVGHSREAKAWEQRRADQKRQHREGQEASACSSSAPSEAEAAAGGEHGSGSGSDSEGGGSSGYESDSSSGSGMSGGFDFGLPSNARDAAHLGDADSAVRALAALLGWSGELEAAIAADAAARAAEAAAAAEAEAAEAEAAKAAASSLSLA